MSKDKSKGATGAVRKEDGAKAPDSPEDTPPAVDTPPAETAPVVETEADKKAKKAVNDKASKEKRKQEKLADEVAAIEAAAKQGHFIEEGKCISCKKGNLGPGERVKAEYFGADGESVLKRLVEAKAVKEVK